MAGVANRSGAKKGQAKTGGRKKGTPNKNTVVREKVIAASGLTPLDYLLSIVRDEMAHKSLRLEAAKSAAPYCHPRMPQMLLHGGAEDAPPINVRHEIPWNEIDQRIEQTRRPRKA